MCYGDRDTLVRFDFIARGTVANLISINLVYLLTYQSMLGVYNYFFKKASIVVPCLVCVCV